MKYFSLLTILAAVALAQTAPKATVSGGQLSGTGLKNGAASFKGIPFAEPPVGDLRWREPKTPKAWAGVRDASKYGPTCAQIDAGWNHNSVLVSSEDCLYLNVWTPEWPSKAAKPVMVWFHGGGNQGGSVLGEGGIEPSFDGERLASHGVVVVSVPYRLGVLGFMAHPELTEESSHHASGNYATLDQVAALQWVKQNIASLGGDPNNVTIFGQSAGAHNVGLLMASPLARGLFQKAIGESGSVIIRGSVTRTREDLEKAGVAFAAKLKAPAKGQIKFLRSLPASEIFKAAPDYNGRGDDRPEPGIDGYAITKLPAQIFRDGEEAPVPLIIGNNARERTTPGGAEGLEKGIAEYYGPLAAKASALYKNAGMTYAPWGTANAQFETDMQFRCSAVTIATWHGRKQPTYEFEFSRAPDARGATHSWELQFVFGNLKQATEPADRALSDQVQEYWTNFAKTGNPNGGSLPNWPKVDAKKGYIDLSATGPVAKTALREPFCALWQEKLAGTIAAAIKK